MAGRKPTPGKIALAIPTVPVLRFHSPKGSDAPSTTLIVDGFDGAWVDARLKLNGFDSKQEAAIAFLDAELLARVGSRREWTRKTTTSVANRELAKIKTIEVSQRKVAVLSMAQFRKENPEFDAVQDDPLVRMMNTMRPDLVIIS